MFQLRPLLTSIDVFSRVEPSDPLTKAVSSVESSHEPIFVFDHNKYIGFTSLTKLIFDQRLPTRAKVAHHLVPVPKLTLKADLFTIVKAMLSTRLYALPIWQDNQVIGVIEAARIFSYFLSQPELFSQLSAQVKFKTPLTVTSHTPAGDIYDLLKHHGYSRLIVTNPDGKVIGLITRRNFRSVLLNPTPRQRYSSRGGQPLSFDPANPITRRDKTANQIMETHVYCLKLTRIASLLKDLIESDYNSAVILDQHDNPVGILSNRDILEGIFTLRPANFGL